MKKIVILCSLLLSNLLHAQSFHGKKILYGGIGQHIGNESSSIAWNIGFLNENTSSMFGGDIAGEGIALDSTYNQYKDAKTAISFNLLWGPKVSDNLFLLGLIGARQETMECRMQSYVGYRCYANSTPEVSYALNYGLHTIYTFNKLSFGIRVTNQSQQLTLGVNF